MLLSANPFSVRLVRDFYEENLMNKIFAKVSAFMMAVVLVFAVQPLVHAEEHNPELIGLIRAGEIAEQNLNARLIEAELDTKDDILCYKIDVAKAGDHFQLWINAHTGSILRAKKPFLSNLWIDVAAGKRLKVARNVPSVLPHMRRLQQETGGDVQYMRFDIADDQPQYEVEIMTQAGPTELLVDAVTGARAAR